MDDYKLKQNEMVSNIYFEAVFPTRKKSFFHQRIIKLVNELSLNDHKYQTNETVRYENYKGKFLFPVNYFV